MIHESLATLKETRYRFTDADTHALEFWLSFTLLWWFLWLLMVFVFAGQLSVRYLSLYVFLTITIYWPVYLPVTFLLAGGGLCVGWWGTRQSRRFSVFLQALFWFFHVFLFFPGDPLPSAPIFSFACAVGSGWCYFHISVCDMQEHPDCGSSRPE